ncbi:hypothetical protein AB4Z52_29370 [Rhizobium sp. 2YAF20]|uniref:hypothetical protein n=1 Tax=Rhizobium sp. 2YAF20 TaxID=3233027 RepID=UPI003F9DB94B
MMITKLIRESMPAIKQMGRDEIAAHAQGLPGVYMIGEEIVWEYPGGEVFGETEHRQRQETRHVSD